MPAVSKVYALPRCTVSLYVLVGDEGLGALVWLGQSVENLRIRESFDEVRHQPTGIPWPEIHHTNEEHEITFDGIWNVMASMQRNVQYALQIAWEDANLGAAATSTITRKYVGVTTSSRDIASRDGNEFVSTNVLKAKYHTADEVSAGWPAGMPPNIGDVQIVLDGLFSS